MICRIACGGLLGNAVGDEVLSLLDKERIVVDLAAGGKAQDRIAVLTFEHGDLESEMRRTEDQRDIEQAVPEEGSLRGGILIFVAGLAGGEVEDQTAVLREQDKGLRRGVIGRDNAAGPRVECGIGHIDHAAGRIG